MKRFSLFENGTATNGKVLVVGSELSSWEEFLRRSAEKLFPNRQNETKIHHVWLASGGEIEDLSELCDGDTLYLSTKSDDHFKSPSTSSSQQTSNVQEQNSTKPTHQADKPLNNIVVESKAPKSNAPFTKAARCLCEGTLLHNDKPFFVQLLPDSLYWAQKGKIPLILWLTLQVI